MLATQLTKTVGHAPGKIKKFSILHVSEYVISRAANKVNFVILKATVKAEGVRGSSVTKFVSTFRGFSLATFLLQGR